MAHNNQFKHGDSYPMSPLNVDHNASITNLFNSNSLFNNNPGFLDNSLPSSIPLVNNMNLRQKQDSRNK